MFFVVYVAIFARPLIEQVADPVKGLADLIYYPSLKQHKGPAVFKLLVKSYSYLIGFSVEYSKYDMSFVRIVSAN